MLRVALEMFAERGFAGTSIGDLAAATGLSKAAFSYHFSSKDEMMLELVDPLLRRMERLVTAHEELLGFDTIESVLGAYIDALLDNRTVAVWIDGDKSVSSHPDIGARLERVNAGMRRLIAAGDPDPDADVRASSVLGVIWRPIRNLADVDVSEHRRQILSAALEVAALK